MWVMGHNTFGSPLNDVAVNLSKADCLVITGEYCDGKPNWQIRAYVKSAELVDDLEEKFEPKIIEVELVDFDTPQEAEKYLSDLVKKLNGGA